MLAIISPAKTLDFENAAPKKLPNFQPHFLKQSQQLIDICRELTPVEIASLMSISDKLAGLNAARFAEWQHTHIMNKMPKLPFMRLKRMFTPAWTLNR